MFVGCPVVALVVPLVSPSHLILSGDALLVGLIHPEGMVVLVLPVVFPEGMEV